MLNGKDAFERMNFLYQAAAQIGDKSSTLSCFYGEQCRLISRKSLQRLQPDVKRQLCKQCGQALQLKHLTAGEVCTINCDKCGSSRRFAAKIEKNSTPNN